MLLNIPACPMKRLQPFSVCSVRAERARLGPVVGEGAGFCKKPLSCLLHFRPEIQLNSFL